jgi:esterase/lipase superfamily enzyme
MTMGGAFGRMLVQTLLCFVTVSDLTKVKAGDDLNHGKFAESPEVVRLIGTRISDGQTLTDSRVGLGDKIFAATASTAAARPD